MLAELKCTEAPFKNGKGRLFPFFGTFKNELTLAKLLCANYVLIIVWINKGKVVLVEEISSHEFIRLARAYTRIQYQTNIPVSERANWEATAKTLYELSSTTQTLHRTAHRRGA